MRTKGTHRHDFNPLLVSDMLGKDEISDDEVRRILDDACHVISGLRKDINTMIFNLESEIKLRQSWLNKER